MKKTCCSHKQAQFLCITPTCHQPCSYLCSTPYDQCKQQHESCHLISLNFITKKCSRITSKEKSLNMKELQKVYDQCRRIVRRCEDYFQERESALRIRELLDPHGLLSEEEKNVVVEFVKEDNRKISGENYEGALTSMWVQKEFISLNLELNSYLKSNKDARRYLDQQLPLINQVSSLKAQSRIGSIKKVEGEKGSAIDKIRSQSKGPLSGKPSSNSQIQSPVKSSKVKKIITPGFSAGNGFQSRISPQIKGHNPVGPLFSKITNNVQTLQSFFYQKFKGANLLYRASENDYLASKFHQKCDGIKNTLTILITEHDKIIGGYTPLPWRSNGDWYDDETQSSFIFSLTEGERFPITSKARAIFCNFAYGPSFGYPDLQIANKAFYNQNSCVNFPQFYNNGNYTQSTASIQILCGTKTGHFRIKQWEVYELEF